MFRTQFASIIRSNLQTVVAATGVYVRCGVEYIPCMNYWQYELLAVCIIFHGSTDFDGLEVLPASEKKLHLVGIL